MLSLEILPSPALRPYVQLFWCLELEGGLVESPPERIAPDATVELVFHYGEPMAMRFAGGVFSTQPRSSAVTLTRRFVEISPRGATGLLSVRFRPWGAHHFLRLPVSELADQQVPADELWGSASRLLEGRLAEAGGIEERIALVEQFLLARLRSGNDRRAEAVVRAVWRHGGSVRVAELCSEVGLTERTLERTCAVALGMPPRSFIRLSRFLHACSELRAGRFTSLTRLAHECGYYDQAHFVADVKAFSGMTPTELAGAPVFSFLEPD